MSATIDEWLMAAEYILTEGNGKSSCANAGCGLSPPICATLDLGSIPGGQEAEPSSRGGGPEPRGGRAGVRARAGARRGGVGADGLMIEVHHEPEKALSDGAQSLLPEQFEQLMREILK
jgi:3-deoxy-7-phosphoheptulonate synthase